MNVRVFQTKEAQDLLKATTNLDGNKGNARLKQITHRSLADLFKAIDDLNITPDEVWAGINCLNRLGQDGEAALLAAGVGLEKYLDIHMDATDEAPGLDGGTPRTIEGPLCVADATVRDGVFRIDVDPDPAAGPLIVHGAVTGQDGKPVAGALAECWHANSNSFYLHFDPAGEQSPFNLRGAVRTGADGKYEFRTLMPVGYDCPSEGAIQQLLGGLARHGNRPAHVYFFIASNDHRKLMTQFNIEGDPLIWDDFAYTTREELIPHVVEKTGGAIFDLKTDAYKDIEFNVVPMPLVQGKDNQRVNRLCASVETRDPRPHVETTMPALIDKVNELDHLLSTAVVDDEEAGIFRRRRDTLTYPDLFELEMKHIFESNWVYLAYESQIPDSNGYHTTWIGRQPIVITRDKTGRSNTVVNACAHKGAMLCRRKHGNEGSFTCPFHGWALSNTGKLLKVKGEKTTEYPVQFNTHGSHDLKKTARFENYRGLLFGSLNADVQPLETYLGGARVIMDQIVNQVPDGLEVLRGNPMYVYDGNQKMQMESDCDGYHVSAVYWNYAATMGRRKEGGTQAADANSWSKSVTGVYGFEHSHILLQTQTMNPKMRPVYAHREEIKARVGETQTGFIVNRTRNLCLYPNVFPMDQFSTQIRVVRPINVGKIEVSIFCSAPKGESATDRATRIRQHEDFFNVTDIGTADNLGEFRACQNDYAGTTALWNNLSRGAPLWVHGPDENATKMGLKPLISGERSEDESLLVCQREYWMRVMRKALKQGCEGVPA